jgi:hypothetical protein
MSLADMLTKPTVLRYEKTLGQDDYGQPVVQSYTRNSTCYYRQQNTLVGDAVYQTREGIKVVLPADTSVDGFKGLSIDSEDYEVSGVPHLQWNPRTQNVEYVMVQVRKVGS